MYSLFEITLSAIDSKLRRVDSLERSMELMMAKMNENSARSDAILSQLKVMDGRLNRLPLTAGTSTTSGNPAAGQTTTTSADQYSLEPRILALDEKVSQIGSKLNVLTYQLDSNSLLWAGLVNNNETASRHSTDDYVSSSSEQARAYVSIGHRGDKTDRTGGSDWGRNGGGSSEETESIRTTMASMDRHLKILIELFSEQMDKMMSAVSDVRSSVTAAHEPHAIVHASETPVLMASGRSSGGSSGVSNAKLDQLYQKMAPLLDVSEKMDQVWNVLIGAKSSVDSLVPTSETLLWQTQRQERALSDIHAELNVKTKQIIDNINQVERQLQLRDQISTSSQSSSSITSSSSNLTKRSKSDVHHDIIANKPQESQQVSVTFKQTAAEAPTSRIVTAAIRAQELSPGPVVAAVLAAAKSSTTSTTATSSTTSTTALPLLPPPPEVVPIPSDIMDSEFLHDDPTVAANQTAISASVTTNTTKKAASSSSAANTTSTTSRSVLLQHIVPAGPTERSRIPTNSAVIFPSVKNKPGFTNTTFFYDYTTPQNIRVRNETKHKHKQNEHDQLTLTPFSLFVLLLFFFNFMSNMEKIRKRKREKKTISIFIGYTPTDSAGIKRRKKREAMFRRISDITNQASRGESFLYSSTVQGQPDCYYL